MTYCQRGRELLQDLQRSDFLPAFDEDGARVGIIVILFLFFHIFISYYLHIYISLYLIIFVSY